MSNPVDPGAELWATRRAALYLGVSDARVRQLDDVLRPVRDARNRRRYFPGVVRALGEQRDRESALRTSGRRTIAELASDRPERDA